MIGHENRNMNYIPMIVAGIGVLLHLSCICFAENAKEIKTHKIVPHRIISNVSLSHKTFNPSNKENAEISYELAGDANVSVGIYDSKNRLIRILSGNKILEAGNHRVIWDGKDQNGLIVTDDVYIYIIYAEDEQGKVSIFDRQETGRLELKLRNPVFNRKTGKIEYVLPKAGRVRMRLGIKDGPLLRTLLDWEPVEAGRQKYLWNGKDDTGKIDLIGTPRLSIVIIAFSLPDNSVITSGNTLTHSEYKKIVPGKKHFSFLNVKFIPLKLDKSSVESNSLYKTYNKENCREPLFDITFPNNPEREGNVPILKGVVPIRISLSGQDKKRLTDSRFEIVLWVDSIFLFEEEDGSSPFNYKLNTRGIRNGYHVLTVNMHEYGGLEHIGTLNIKVKIRR